MRAAISERKAGAEGTVRRCRCGGVIKWHGTECEDCWDQRQYVQRIGRDPGRKPDPPRLCVVCDRGITSTNPRAVTCGPECRKVADRERHRRGHAAKKRREEMDAMEEIARLWYGPDKAAACLKILGGGDGGPGRGP